MPLESDADNPFPGLRPFELHEASLFFGRDDQTDRLLDTLRGRRFVAVIGDSGCGKSSLVRAGLLPAVYLGYLGTGSHWRTAVIRPGSAPLDQLERGLRAPEALGDVPELRDTLERSSLGLVHAARGAGPENFLLVVDQFEELLRCVRESGDRGVKDEEAAFVSLLLAAAEQHEVPLYIVLTMRSDFLGDCARFRGLPEALSDAQFLVPRMTRDQLQEAIEGPVAAAGARIEARLVQRLLNDAGEDPDHLPVLQYTLMRMWGQSAGDRAAGGAIDLPHYESVQRMDGCLDADLSSAFGECRPHEQRIARKIFQCLTEIDRGREKRRMATVQELGRVSGAFDDPEVTRVIGHFRRPGRLFLTSPSGESLTSTSDIDISHESLIRSWRELQTWMADEVESARIYRRLADSAARGFRYRNPELGEALRWRAREAPNAWWAKRYDRDRGRSDEPSVDFPKVMRFLDRSRLWRNGFWSLAVAVATVVVLALGYAVQQRTAASLEGARLSVARARSAGDELDTLAADDRDGIERRALLGLQAIARIRGFRTIANDTHPILTEAEMIVSEALTLLPHTVARMKPNRPVQAIAFSRDGKYLASAGGTPGTVQVWDVAACAGSMATTTPCEKSESRQPGRFAAMAFSPDAVWVAHAWVASERSGRGLRLWNPATGQEMPLAPADGEVTAMTFSEDGLRLTSVTSQGTVDRWRVPQGTNAASAANETYAGAAALSGDGKRVAGFRGGGAVFWEQETGRRLGPRDYGTGVRAMALSVDGGRMVTLSDQTTVRVWDESGSQLTSVEHVGNGKCVALSADGKRVASGDSEGMVRLWDATKNVVMRWRVHQSGVRALAFSPDGQRLASGDDTSLIVWEPDADAQRLDVGSLYSLVAFSSDGRFAVSSDDRSLTVWDLAAAAPPVVVGSGDADDLPAASIRASSGAGSIPGPPTAMPDQFTDPTKENQPVELPAVAVSAGGTWAARGSNGALRVWTAARPDAPRTLRDGFMLTFSPDGRWVASGGSDTTARVSDDAAGKELGARNRDSVVTALAFAPDGKRIAFASADGAVLVWDVRGEADGAGVKRMGRHDGQVRAVAFSPNGERIASGSNDGMLRVWEVATGSKVFEASQARDVVGVAFSPSGERIASGSNEGVLRVWEVATGSEVFEARQAREVVDVAFSPDGRWVASGGADGRAHVWDADTGARVVSLEHSSRAERSLRAVAFVEKNGRVRLATAGGGVIRAHSLVFGDELVAKACARLQRPNSNDREIDAGELGKICPNWR